MYIHRMFIRESKTTNRKTGKVYVKHVLVESVRTERGPRQRNVMTLGSLELPRELWKPLAQALEDYLYGSQGLEAISNYELPEELIEEIQRQQSIIREKRAIEARKKAQADEAEAENAEETDSPLLAVSSEKPPEEPQGDQKRQLEVVDTSTLSFSESRTLGPELLAHQAWMQLEFEQHLKSCGFSNREIALAAAVIWGRLISPGSDLSTWRWLRNESSLNEFFPANISRVHKDKIYEIPDKLLAHKDKLEDKLYARQRRLFPGRKSVHLFDLTNFYFEGKCEKNKLAKRGKSKEKRSQNALVSLALIVDQDGFPVKSKVYTGNVSEPETLEQILKECGLLNDDLIKPVLIMDRGIATKENVSFIKEKLFPYAVIQRADHCKEYKSHFEDLESFTKIEDSKGQTVYVKNVDGKTLCCSDARRSKEEAIQNKKKERALADLELLNTALEKGTLKDPAKIYERLGRIRERHAGMAYAVCNAQNAPACHSDLEGRTRRNEITALFRRCRTAPPRGLQHTECKRPAAHCHPVTVFHKNVVHKKMRLLNDKHLQSQTGKVGLGYSWLYSHDSKPLSLFQSGMSTLIISGHALSIASRCASVFALA